MSKDVFPLAVLAQSTLVPFFNGREKEKHRKILSKNPSDEKDK